jgi:hypothetical protein
MGTTTVFFVGTGTGYWTCPSGVTSVTVSAWGGGGGGYSSSGHGGGGGGSYTSGSVSVTAGTTYSVNVGAGGATGSAGGASWFSSSTTLNANGGSAGTTSAGGAGGTTGTTGTTKYAGGAGSSTGGGGGAAGPDGAGVGGSGTSGGNGDNSHTGGGSGGSSGNAGGGTSNNPDTSNGGCTGGGGGGNAGVGGFPGGGGGASKAGGNGLVSISYSGSSNNLIFYYNTTSSNLSLTWTAPSSVSSVTVECWGAGSGGGTDVGSGTDGGCGGGYAKGTSISVTGGSNYSLQIGAQGAAGSIGNAGGNGGATWFNSSAILQATGGTSDTSAGTGSGSSATTTYTGGAGGSTVMSGGGAAGPDGNGKSVSGSTGNGGAGDNGSGGAGGTYSAGGAGTAGGNNSLGGGGGGGSASVGGSAGGNPGGGGGAGSGGNGGKGGYGQLIITYAAGPTTVSLTSTIFSLINSPPTFGPKALLQGASGVDMMMQSRFGSGVFTAKMNSNEFTLFGAKFGPMSGSTYISGNTKFYVFWQNAGKYSMPMPSSLVRSDSSSKSNFIPSAFLKAITSTDFISVATAKGAAAVKSIVGSINRLTSSPSGKTPMSGLGFSDTTSRNTPSGKTPLTGKTAAEAALSNAGKYSLPMPSSLVRSDSFGRSNPTGVTALLAKVLGLVKSLNTSSGKTPLLAKASGLVSLLSSPSGKILISALTISVYTARSQINTSAAIRAITLSVTKILNTSSFKTPLFSKTLSLTTIFSSILPKSYISTFSSSNSTARTPPNTGKAPIYAKILSNSHLFTNEGSFNLAMTSSIASSIANLKVMPKVAMPILGRVVANTFLSVLISGKTALTGDAASSLNGNIFGKFSMPLPAIKSIYIATLRNSITTGYVLVGRIFTPSRLSSTPAGKTPLSTKASSAVFITNIPYFKAAWSATSITSSKALNTVKTGYVLVSRALALGVGRISPPTGKTSLSSKGSSNSSVPNKPLFSANLAMKSFGQMGGFNNIKTGYYLVGRILALAANRASPSYKAFMSVKTLGTGSSTGSPFFRAVMNTSSVFITKAVNTIRGSYGIISTILSSSKMKTGYTATTNLYASGSTVSEINNLFIARALIAASRSFSSFSVLGNIIKYTFLSGSIFNTSRSILGLPNGIVFFLHGLGSFISVIRARVRSGLFFDTSAKTSFFFFGRGPIYKTVQLRSNVLTLTKTRATNAGLIARLKASSKSITKSSIVINTVANMFGAISTSTNGVSIGVRQLLKAFGSSVSSLVNRFNIGFSNPNFIDYKTPLTGPWYVASKGPITLYEKDPVETILITYDFSYILDTPYEFIESVASATVSTFVGTDTSLVLSSPATIENATQVVQMVNGGLNGSIYKIKLSVSTNMGQVITSTALLPVVTQ